MEQSVMSLRAILLLGVCIAGVLSSASITNGKNGGWKYRNTNRVGNCSFERSMCGWTGMKKGGRHQLYKFDWLRRRGTTPSSGTGPPSAASGSYYMFIESSSPRKPGDRGSLSSGPYDGVMCMTFNYHMYGVDTNQLEIHVDDTSEYGQEMTVWSKRGEQGNRWKTANVTVYGNDYRVLIVGVVGKGYRGDIAIDNVTFTDRTCGASEDPEQLMKPFQGPPPGISIAKGDCEFDKNSCEWKNDKSGKFDQFDWQRSSGKTSTSKTGPNGDRKGGKGGYAFIEASAPRRQGDKAWLLSPRICGRVCMRFYYNMYGVDTGSLTIFRRDGFGRKMKLDKVWRRVGDQGTEWQRDMVELNSDRTCYKVIIEGTRGRGYLGDIAIDGIVVQAGTCCKIRSELNLLQKNGNCNFDNGWTNCGWRNAVGSDVFDWTISNSTTPSQQTGPTNAKGGYIYADASEPRVKGDTAVLVSGILHGSLCIRFKYHMYGPDVGSLRVYRNGDGVYQQLLWERSGNHGDVWRNGAVSIDCSVNSYFIELESVRGTDWRGDIAVDEIRFTNGVCPPGQSDIIPTVPPTTAPPNTPASFQGMCDFNRGFCYWENDITDKGEWTRYRGKTPSDTTGPSEGYEGIGDSYLYVEASDISAGDVARLLLNSPLTGTVCVKTLYHMFGRGIGKLAIDMKEENSKSWVMKWNTTGNMGNLWRQASVEITGKNFRVSLAAHRGPTFNGDIAIDNLEIHKGNCDDSYVSAVNLKKVIEEYGCNFEKCSRSSKCTHPRTKQVLGCKWTQPERKEDECNWRKGTRTTPSSNTGPDGPFEGKHYLYLEASSPRKEGDRAKLKLKIDSLQIGANTELCMRFYYHMYGKGMGSLEVYRVNPTLPNMKDWLFRKSGQSTRKLSWYRFQRSFKVTGDEEIIIEGQRGKDYTSDMAIDGISFTLGYCPRSDKVAK